MQRDEVRFLASQAGKDALARLQDYDFSGDARISAVARVRAEYPEHAAALVATVLARQKAVHKLRDAHDWLLTVEAVEQATAWPVAARRAQRLAGYTVHDLTCSVGAEMTELVRHCPLVVGSDIDPARALMAAHNVPEAAVLRADALAPASRAEVFLADPARRSGGRRIHDPAALQPPLPALLSVLSSTAVSMSKALKPRTEPMPQHSEYAIKCAPGLRFDDLAHAGEVEITGLDGGVREACLWSPGLSFGVRRRAVVMRSGRGTESEWTEEFTDAEPETDPEDISGEADAYLIDPEGAVVRAGLVRQFAARYGLRQLDSRIAYLTGAEIPPGYSGFAVLERHRFDLKTLRRRLRELDCGALEICVRGVNTDPDLLRKKLALRGDRHLGLVVTRIESAAVAFICASRRHRPRSDVETKPEE